MIDSEEQVRMVTALYPCNSQPHEPLVRTDHQQQVLPSHRHDVVHADVALPVSASSGICLSFVLRVTSLPAMRSSTVTVGCSTSRLQQVSDRLSHVVLVLGPHYTRISFTERQQNLRTQYFFTCHCEHCASDARTADVINVSSPTQLFCFNIAHSVLSFISAPSFRLFGV